MNYLDKNQGFLIVWERYAGKCLMKRNKNRYVEKVSFFRQVLLENEIIENYCYNGV